MFLFSWSPVLVSSLPGSILIARRDHFLLFMCFISAQTCRAKCEQSIETLTAALRRRRRRREMSKVNAYIIFAIFAEKWFSCGGNDSHFYSLALRANIQHEMMKWGKEETRCDIYVCVVTSKRDAARRSAATHTHSHVADPANRKSWEIMKLFYVAGSFRIISFSYYFQTNNKDKSSAFSFSFGSRLPFTPSRQKPSPLHFVPEKKISCKHSQWFRGARKRRFALFPSTTQKRQILIETRCEI